jgi:thiamine-monophosphate kinase
VALSPAAARAVAADPSALAAVLTGGDDYEVLLAVAADLAEAFERAAADRAVRVAAIGTLVPAFAGRVRVERHGHILALERLAYRHF